MHACGHDMHAVCLTGAATLPARARDPWKGTLLVVFQPAGTGRRRPRHGRGRALRALPETGIVLGQHVGPCLPDSSATAPARSWRPPTR